jgi:hypothetical protein
MEQEDAALQILTAWHSIIKAMAYHGLGLACFNQKALFITKTGSMAVLPCGPLVVLEQAYIDSEAESVIVGEPLCFLLCWSAAVCANPDAAMAAKNVLQLFTQQLCKTVWQRHVCQRWPTDLCCFVTVLSIKCRNRCIAAMLVQSLVESGAAQHVAGQVC